MLQELLVLALLALAVLVVLNQANPLTTRLGRDSGMYAYVGSHVLRGETPYVTAWEHKPPGIFFINAAALGLAGGTRWGIWLAEWVSLFSAAVLGFHALKRHFGNAASVLASLIWLGGLGLVLEGGNFTEEYALPLGFGALLLFSLTLDRPPSLREYGALGLAAGSAFMLRPNNIGVQLAIVLAELALVLRGQRQWRGALRGWLAMALGALVPVLAVVIYFGLRGAVGPYIEAAFLFNASYGGHPDFLGALIGGVKNLGFAAGFGLVGTSIAIRELPGGFRKRTLDPVLLWLVLDFVLEIALSGLSGRAYPHYFISWLPWVAVASALLIARLFPALDVGMRRSAVPVLLACTMVLALAAWTPLKRYADSFAQLASRQGPIQRGDQLAAYVNEHTTPDQTVYVWGGEAGINFLARRDAPSAHFSYAQLGPSPLTERLSREFYEDVLANPPALILDMHGDLLPPLSMPDPQGWLRSRGLYVTPYVQDFFDFVHAGYALKTTLTGVDIYALDR